jgi:phosphate transport system protein
MNTDHIQSSFDKNLQKIHREVVMMAEMASQELSDSIQAFAERDQEQANEAIAADDLVNASERLIDNHIIQTIVRNQPVASDCRHLIAALRISKDLERIGDYATNIAAHSSTLCQLEPTGEEQRVIDMGHAVHTMMQEVVEAFEDEDVNKAQLVRQQDVDIDELYTKIFSDLLKISSKNAAASSACTHLAFVARSLERIGDHITDIAEEILYIVKGEFPADERLKADESTMQIPN